MNRQERRKAAKENPLAVCQEAERLCDSGEARAAVVLLLRQKRSFEVLYSLGNAYRLSGDAAAALGAYKAALGMNAGFAGAHHGMGLALRKLEREGEAVAYFRETVRLMPGWGIGWRDLGMALAVMGDLQGAEAALAKAVALAPGLGDAQRHLAALRGPAGPGEMARLEAQAANPALPEEERVDSWFALGRLAEKAEDYALAFRYFSKANAMLRAKNPFDRERLRRDVDRIIGTFTPEVMAGLPAGDEAEVPVFVVGMPRSGSSLFEQIAASHSAVFGAGEQAGIGAVAARIGWAPGPLWTAARLREEAAWYLAGLRARAGVAARIIDKMPDNVFQLGLISALFPAARVVFCERDARDVAISCFTQHFAQPYGFDTDLGDCLFRGQEVGRLMVHWRRVLPLRWMDMGYEAVVAAPEVESRQLIGFLGLEWEAGCLAFHETAREVRTASWAQVRRPLYGHAVGRWKHYEQEAGF